MMVRWLFIFSLGLLTACSAYRLGGPKPAFTRIEVAPIRNSTSRPGTRAVLQEKLLEALSGDPRIKIGPGQAVLSTEITHYKREGQTANSTDAFLISTYRVTFIVRCTLTTEGGKRVLFKDRDFSAAVTFQPKGDSTAEELSLGPSLFADIAAQIREAATTAW